MQYKSPWAEMPHLYEDFSERHADTHMQRDASYEEREIELKRVMNISQNPLTGDSLSPQDIPSNAILSHIGHDVSVESFAFKPTARELLTRMELFLEQFTAIVRRHQADSEYYLLQIREAFHFAFGSVTPPGVVEDYATRKRLEANEDELKRLSLATDKNIRFNRLESWRHLVHCCQKFLDTVQPCMRFKEIKMNPDGHVVLRMTLVQADSFLDFRNTWQRLFSGNYVRYDDPEKITTLACVIGVVDKYALEKSSQMALEQDLQALFLSFTEQMQGAVYSFDAIELSESSNRMLQSQDMYGRLTVQKGYCHLNTRVLDDLTEVDTSSWSQSHKNAYAVTFFTRRNEAIKRRSVDHSEQADAVVTCTSKLR